MLNDDKKKPRFKPLNGKQREFIRLYVRNGGHGTKAAIEAGYGEKSAHVHATRLLKREDVQEGIKTEECRIRARLDMSDDEILAAYRAIAKADVFDFVRIDAQGRLLFTGPSDDLCRITQTPAVKGIKPTKYGLEIKFYDRKAALDTLAEINGLKDRKGKTGFELTNEEIDAIVREGQRDDKFDV